MNVPKNVLWFEVLLYLSLTMDTLLAAFQDRTPTADKTAQTFMVETLIAICLIQLLVYFVWLAARRRKNWPRWALATVLALSTVGLVQTIGEKGVQIENAIDVISSALAVAGLYFSFTGDAVGWFNA
jgi:hypothetical protein